MSRHILSFLFTLPLALILSQQLQDDLLHLRRGVVLGKEFPNLIGAEADLFALVMLRYELVQTLVMGIGFKRCENCGMLFVPSGRSDTLYCDFRAKGETQPCNKIGANRKAKEKVAKDPVLQEHRRAYQRLNKRKEYG